MTSYRKKKEEEIIINHFRDHYPDFPKGRLVRSEAPDFILKINTRKSIGIELTSVGLPVNNFPRDQKVLWELVNERINDKEEKLFSYNKKNINGCWLIIFFDSMERKWNSSINNLSDSWNQSSGFQKIFLFELFGNNIYALK